MRRIIALIGFFMLVTAVGYLWLSGISVLTTSEAFVERAGMPLFETENGKKYVRLHVTPAPWPVEATTMYRASSFGIPVKVELRAKEETVIFVIEGLSREGDFLVQCSSNEECKKILKAASMPIPEEIANSTFDTDAHARRSI
jgi:hypothetical protein